MGGRHVIANQLSLDRMSSREPGDLLRSARLRADLSQRALARRARTAQSVVARIESGATSPSWATLERLLRAAGFELSAEVHPASSGRSHMLDDVPRILRLSPEQRLVELREAARMLSSAERIHDERV
ncbi:MAG: helix-turn-helix domain-containing protein [Steroidobacteraceae bacterium]